MMKTRNFYIETFGCQMNVHDSEKLHGLFVKDGWQSVTDPEQADVIVLNTCSVREKAEQKVFSRFGRLVRLKRKKPDLVLILSGCMAQAWGARLSDRMPFLDMIVGPGAYWHIPDFLKSYAKHTPNIIAIPEPDEIFTLSPDDLPLSETCSAWITIMEGCNNFCSYCVVPYVRGRERSRPSEEIISEIQSLVRKGIKEITLLGQNVNSFKGCPGGFPELLYQLNRIDGLHRIRFTTSHPKDVSKELIHALAELPKICEYLHFPAQSGSSKILSRMRRGYSREEYLEKVAMIRDAVPEIALSTDVIVGFPGEKEDDFLQTMSLLEDVRYDNVFAFIYSIRKGTKASAFDDDVPREVKSKRLEMLIHRQRQISLDINRTGIGKTLEVLVSGPAKRGDGKMQGRTRHNRIVNFKGEYRAGDLVHIRIESASPNCLYGKIAD
ncbi:tRNA (N6-isopentenyl adenosine(37)-C2)-methylthiotransferase MiaB [bacterium]|nr:tRNA (N6-isopentenyl adenosine(37)-C2)-methylthiotransferase MiaB [candidate division CSSED10-310 bacterium]